MLTVTLNRPEQRNAFDDPMRREMRDLWTQVYDDESVRCVVLTGAGKGFCAGADMGTLDGARSPLGDGIDDELCFLPGRRLAVPVIVAVNGVCAGGGLHYVADADIVIASEDAWFTDPHVGVGQVSGIEAPSLGLRVPLGMLARMVLLGRHERWDADQALRLGLVSEVLPRDQLLRARTSWPVGSRRRRPRRCGARGRCIAGSRRPSWVRPWPTGGTGCSATGRTRTAMKDPGRSWNAATRSGAHER